MILCFEIEAMRMFLDSVGIMHMEIETVLRSCLH